MTALPTKVVGIGASAGGLEAFQRFFKAMPPDSGLAFVVILHLPANRRSMLPEIIARWTTMQVIEVDHEAEIKPDRIYVPRSHSIITLRHGRLMVSPREVDSPRDDRVIDGFFDSLAAGLAENAIGIVLSGTGTDGSLGLKAIKENGGLTIAQATRSEGDDGSKPQYEGMPAGAIATGAVDLVVDAEAMPGHLMRLRRTLEPASTAAAAATIEQSRQRICDIIRERLGHDFSGYNEPTFLRRVQRRMQVLAIETVPAYLERLEQDRAEVTLLFRDLLIRVTSFFRDPDVFDLLGELAIPHLFEGKHADATVRIWVPGCATGEEAYSLAILLREHLDQLLHAPKVQVFATDIDEPAIAIARAGRYPATLLEGLSEARRERFFSDIGSGFAVAKEIRELCTFSSHSLVRDPPFSRMDMVSCRNLLIYLDMEMQGTVIPAFHYSLNPTGILLLGSSETVAKHDDLFEPLDKGARIFLRRDVPSPTPALFAPPGSHPAAAKPLQKRPSVPFDLPSDLRWPQSPPKAEESGRGTNDGRAAQADRATSRGGIVAGLRGAARTAVGWVYPDVHAATDIQRQLDETRSKLQALSEEHSTAVEELRSANEELLSVNEEVQSTIEELETSKEEIQSVNEELQTVNTQLSGKIEELDRANSDLKNLFASTDVATVFLDRDLVIRGYTPAVNAIYNLIPSDQGRPLTDIASHLDYSDLREDVRTVLATLEPLERRVAHKDGDAHYIMRVLPYRGVDGAVNGALVTFLNVTSMVEAETHQRLLVDELNHRVKNMLTVVISLASQTMRRATTLDDFSEAFFGRVRSLNASYTLLSQENWANVSLRAVLDEETRAFRAADGRNFVIEGPPVRLRPQGALALGMVLHELTTNAVKYGALSGPAGVVTVRWAFVGHEAAPRLDLEWIEHGGPTVEEPSRRGFGRTIIERGLAHELSGQASLEFRPEGLHARIIVPVGSAITFAEEASP